MYKKFIWGWRRKWKPTPLFLPGESQGQDPGGLLSVGSHRVGHDGSDLAAAVYLRGKFWEAQERNEKWNPEGRESQRKADWCVRYPCEQLDQYLRECSKKRQLDGFSVKAESHPHCGWGVIPGPSSQLFWPVQLTGQSHFQQRESQETIGSACAGPASDGLQGGLQEFE